MKIFSFIHSLLDKKASWFELLQLRNSFLSKALMAFSIGTVGLANFAAPLAHLGVDLTTLRLTFIGSLLFLCGYVILTLGTPIEFKGVSNVFDLVNRMCKIHDYSFYVSRCAMLRALLVQHYAQHVPSWLQGEHILAKRHLLASSAITAGNWTPQVAAALYHADATLRQYEKPIVRFISLFLLLIGLLFLFIPTTLNFVKALREL